jgi:hypothetical protein
MYYDDLALREGCLCANTGHPARIVPRLSRPKYTINRAEVRGQSKFHFLSLAASPLLAGWGGQRRFIFKAYPKLPVRPN